MVREFYERQRADAERILSLSDTVANLLKENKELKAAKAAPAPKNPDNGK